MSKLVLIVMVVVLFAERCSSVIYHLSEKEYNRMPPLVHVDSYEDCLQNSGLYCSASFDLVSNGPSELMDLIKEYSAHRIRHFNHTKLRYGICVTQTCKKFYKEGTTGALEHILEECLNETLAEGYGLGAKISGEADCDGPMKNTEINMYDTIVAFIFMGLIMVTIIGSLSEIKSKQGNSILSCFSLRRNWRKLMTPPAEGPDLRLQNLKGICGIRAINTGLVILGHSVLRFVVSGKNTQWYEDADLVHYGSSGNIYVQTFFVLSGFLMAYNLEIYREKHRLNGSFVFKGMFLRWLRLTPLLAVVVALKCTWFQFTPRGPFWHQTVGREVEVCRRDWWYVMLYLINYVDHSECMTDMWYLSADMQLSILGLIVCILVVKKKQTLGLLVFSGILANAANTYFQDLHATCLFTSENARTFVFQDPTFNVYKRGHTNLVTYVIGLALGLFVYELQKNGFTSKDAEKYRRLYRWSVPALLFVVYFGLIFYTHRPRHPLWFRVLYAAMLRPVFSCLVSAVIFGLVFQIDSTYRRILEWKVWAPLSRVSYSVYMIHVSIIRISVGRQTDLIQLSWINLVLIVASNIITCFLAAVPFWLLVEAPVEQLMKLAFSPGEQSRKNKLGDEDGDERFSVLKKVQ